MAIAVWLRRAHVFCTLTYSFMLPSHRWVPASRSLLVLALIALLLSTVVTVWVIAGVSGLTYTLLFVAICAPGLPLGFALFGRGHAAGWLAGMLLGYATISFASWAVVFTGHPSTLAFATAWATAGLAAWAITHPFETPFVVLPRWTTKDSTALILLLLMVPALGGATL
jgi:hypothetical protein